MNKIISALCWLMSLSPLPSPIARDEWRDLAKMFNGEPLPDERKKYLKARVNAL